MIDNESKNFKSSGLFPISVFVGIITYSLSFAVVPYTFLSLNMSEKYIDIIFPFLILFPGFLGPMFLYIIGMKWDKLLRIIIGIGAFLFFCLEIILNYKLMNILIKLAEFNVVFLRIYYFIGIGIFLLNFAAIPLSFRLENFFPTKIPENLNSGLMDLRNLIIIAPILWAFSCFGVSIVIAIILKIIPIGAFLGILVPLAAFLSSLNLELFNYIALKISNYKKLNQT